MTNKIAFSSNFKKTSRLGLLLCIAIVVSDLITQPAYAEHGIQHTPDGPVIELSESTLAAIDSGISLTFVCDYAVVNSWLFLNWPKQRKQHEFVISKHALSDRYLVHQDGQATPMIFRSTSQGVAFISKTIQNLFRDYAASQPDTQLRVSLSKYELPAPMRLTAFISEQWDFDSGWGRWQSGS